MTLVFFRFNNNKLSITITINASSKDHAFLKILKCTHFKGYVNIFSELRRSNRKKLLIKNKLKIIKNTKLLLM